MNGNGRSFIWAGGEFWRKKLRIVVQLLALRRKAAGRKMEDRSGCGL
jgi:hypothetical protein